MAAPSKFLRQAQEARALRYLAASIAAWTAIAAVMTLARIEDAVSAGRGAWFWSEFVGNLPYFVPLMALSWTLQLCFQRWPLLTQSISRTAAVFAAVLLLFFPAYVISEATISLVQQGQPVGHLWSVLARQSRFGWWIDAMIVLGATAFHYALASRRRLVEREVDLHRRESENLELRLSLLQSQLEPHFLFNALNSVAALVRTDDREMALEVMERLSELLRYALRASRAGMMTMQDELQFTERYLSVQAMRFGDRLQIERKVENVDWSGIECPPLLFQPLVENALRHGIETSPGSNRLEFAAYLEGEDVCVAIANDVDRTRDAQPGNGMGLSLVADRLHAVFGSKGAIETRMEGDRFLASIRFPVGGHDG